VLHELRVERSEEIRIAEQAAVSARNGEVEVRNQCALELGAAAIVNTRRCDILHELGRPAVGVDELEVTERIGWVGC
jgi:hypothetical protein